ncbi:MAG: flagellar export chaperone FliS [Treponema sp.]|nr:flagellar export chaperone FliS [Treponema sp.]
MGYNQAYNAYQTTNIRTASQGKLIVLLYEEAVRQLNTASSLFDAEGKLAAKNIEKFGACLLKTQDIITELEVSLNMEQGGEIAQNLMSLYIYFNKELTDATIGKDKQKVDFILNMLNELLSSWRQAANSSANAPAMQVQQALNIQG